MPSYASQCKAKWFVQEARVWEWSGSDSQSRFEQRPPAGWGSSGRRTSSSSSSRRRTVDTACWAVPRRTTAETELLWWARGELSFSRRPRSRWTVATCSVQQQLSVGNQFRFFSLLIFQYFRNRERIFKQGKCSECDTVGGDGLFFYFLSNGGFNMQINTLHFMHAYKYFFPHVHWIRMERLHQSHTGAICILTATQCSAKEKENYVH